jgi:photosystem II stability/assembly factor-like uncharacterized protein
MNKVIFLLLTVLYSAGLLSQYNWLNPSPPGDDLRSVFFVHKNVGYAVGIYGRAVRTTDGGETWKVLNTNTTTNLNGVHFVHSNYGFAVGDNGLIIKTTNGGNSWTTILSDQNHDLYSVFFTDLLTGYACGTKGYILRTNNGGIDWILCSSGVETKLYSMDFPDRNIGYIVGGGGTQATPGTILKTMNAGYSWFLLTDSLEQSFYSVDFIDTLCGYAAGNFSYIAKTEDGGYSWSTCNNPDIHHLRCIKFRDHQVGYANSSSGKVIKTVNGGLDWSILNTPTSGILHSINIADSNQVCIVGRWGITLLSNDQGNSFVNAQGKYTNYLCDIQRTNNNHIFVTGSQVIIKSMDNGTSWEYMPAPELGNCISGHFHDYQHGAAVTNNGIYMTHDSGRSWAKGYESIDSTWIRDVHMISESLGYAVGSWYEFISEMKHGGLLKTIDGISWSIQNLSSTESFNKVYFKDNSRGFILGSHGKMHLSDDAGNSWTSLDIGTTAYLTDIVFVNESIGFLIGSFFGTTIWKSSNGGDNWSSIYHTNRNYQSIHFDDSLNGRVIGNDTTILGTNDGGLTWTVEPSFTTCYLSDLLLISDSSGFVVGTNGTFVSFGGISVGISETRLKDSFRLFPNPFNQTFCLEISANKNETVTIQLLDIYGREIHKEAISVITGMQTKCIHISSEHKPGTYFYRMEGKNYRRSGKLIKL